MKTYVSIELCPENNFFSIITIKKFPGIIRRVFGKKTEVKRFRGNGTVWHNMKTNLRAGCTGNALHDFIIGSTLMEEYLFEIWYKQKTQPTTTPAT